LQSIWSVVVRPSVDVVATILSFSAPLGLVFHVVSVVLPSGLVTVVSWWSKLPWPLVSRCSERERPFALTVMTSCCCKAPV
jgi:hypothetical protein